MKRAALLAMLLAPLSPAAAFAQVTPERAATLQAQIKDWLQTTVGDSLKVDRSPITVTAAGDHFDVAYPLAAASGAPMVTGKMTDAGSGRWSINDVTVPSPSVFHYRLPPTKTGTPGGEATTTLTIGQQQQQFLLDPSFATPSTGSSTFGDLSITTQLPGNTQLSHLDTATSSATITPAADGRVNVTSNGSLKGYTIKMSDPSSPQAQAAIAVAIGNATVLTTMTNVSREHGAQLIHLLAQASQNRRADKAAGTKDTALDQATSLSLLSALADLGQSATIAETLDDLTVTTQGMTGTLKQLALGLDTSVTDGKVKMRLPLSADGLVLPDLGLGNAVVFIPTYLSLTPTLSNVPGSALMQSLKNAIQKQSPDDQDVAALFSQGPINAGLDDLHLNVAGSTFAGHVAMVLASPNDVSATGQITAENFDSLQQAMSIDPLTVGMTPLVTFMKGIARTEQGHLVWDVSYQGSRLLINNQDISALMAAVAPPTPPPPAPTRPRPPAPRPTRP